MKVHPITAIFPMMADDDLEGLAADIRQNGQRLPIMMQDDVLVDGRNRLRACEIAGVEPWFERLAEDTDPVAYIISINIGRRHLSKGQQALVVAMVYPEPAKGVKLARGSVLETKTDHFSPALLSQARTVLTFSQDLAKSVIAGTEKFAVAYEKAGAAEAKAREAAQSRSARARKAPLPSYVPSDPHRQEEPATVNSEAVDLARKLINEIIGLIELMTKPERLCLKRELIRAANAADDSEIAF